MENYDGILKIEKFKDNMDSLLDELRMIEKRD
jgi:hypothetical protein